MKNVSFVIPEKQQNQLMGLISYYLVSQDAEVGKYLTRLAVAIQSIDSYYNIDENNYEHRYKPVNRSPYGRSKHGKTDNPDEVGYLDAPLNGYIVRNLDNSNRLVAFEIDQGLIGIVNVLGHYEENIFNARSNILDLGDDLKNIYRNKELYLEQRNSSDLVLSSLFSCVNAKMSFREFKKECKDHIFPTSIEMIKKSFESCCQAKHNVDSQKIKPAVTQKIETLDAIIYRTLRNVCNISYFIARVSDLDERNKLANIVKPNKDSITQYSNLVKLFNDNKDVLNVKESNTPSSTINDKLVACSKAINNAFEFGIDELAIKDFVKVFKQEMNIDVHNICFKNNEIGGTIKTSDLNFENTTIFLEELATSLQRNLPLDILSNSKMSDKSIYFNIPFDKRDQARNLGAKWDINKHCWYIPDGSDPNPFDEKGWDRVNPTNKIECGLFEQVAQSSLLQDWKNAQRNIKMYGSFYAPNDKQTINTQTVDSQEQSVQQPKNTQVQNNTQEYPSQVNKRRGRGR